MGDTGNGAMHDEILLQVMVCMAMSDKSLDESETAVICDIFEKVAGTTIIPEDVEAVVQSFSSGPNEILTALAEAQPELSKTDKEHIIKGAYLVLLADGVIAAQEKNSLRRMADALKMPEIHYQAVLEELEHTDAP